MGLVGMQNCLTPVRLRRRHNERKTNEAVHANQTGTILFFSAAKTGRGRRGRKSRGGRLRTGAGAGAELGGGVLEDDVGVLAGEELRVPQLPAPGDCRQGYGRRNQLPVGLQGGEGSGRREARHL